MCTRSQRLPAAVVQADDAEYPAKVEAIKKALALWDSYLSQSKYVAGDEFTLADLALGPWLLFFDRQSATFKDFPKLAAYVALLKVRQACMWYALHLTITPGMAG